MFTKSQSEMTLKYLDAVWGAQGFTIAYAVNPYAFMIP